MLADGQNLKLETQKLNYNTMKLPITLLTEGVKDTDPIAKLANEIYASNKGVTSSKLRKFYGAVKKIEVDFNARSREIILLAPQLAYAIGRETSDGPRKALINLYESLEPLLKNIGEDKKKFSNFTQVMEVLVAYHRYEEGMFKVQQAYRR